MKHKSKKWMLQTKRADFRKISEKFGISPVLARCIVNRRGRNWKLHTSRLEAAAFAVAF